MTTADFGRIETCNCCGKSIKRPVRIKNLPGLYGKDCRDAILDARWRLQPTGVEGSVEREMEKLRYYYPRSWEKIVAFAQAGR